LLDGERPRPEVDEEHLRRLVQEVVVQVDRLLVENPLPAIAHVASLARLRSLQERGRRGLRTCPRSRERRHPECVPWPAGAATRGGCPPGGDLPPRSPRCRRRRRPGRSGGWPSASPTSPCRPAAPRAPSLR